MHSVHESDPIEIEYSLWVAKEMFSGIGILPLPSPIGNSTAVPLFQDKQLAQEFIDSRENDPFKVGEYFACEIESDQGLIDYLNMSESQEAKYVVFNPTGIGTTSIRGRYRTISAIRDQIVKHNDLDASGPRGDS